MVPFYDDGQVTLYCADLRDVDLRGVAAAVVTSPPYNVGLSYDTCSDRLAWPEYWQLAHAGAEVMEAALVPGGRAWLNTAVSVPEADPASQGKARVMLAHRWASALEAAGLALVDQVAWCSARGAGTAWGSWASPAAPNLRGDYEAITVACGDGWERTPPAGLEGWRDGLGGWPGLCSTVWNLTPAHRVAGGHPAPFPVELARRCIRLSTWPSEVVLDPFAGTGTTLLAARQLGAGRSGSRPARRTAPRRSTGSPRAPWTSTAPPDPRRRAQRPVCAPGRSWPGNRPAPVLPLPRMEVSAWPTLRPASNTTS